MQAVSGSVTYARSCSVIVQWLYNQSVNTAVTFSVLVRELMQKTLGGLESVLRQVLSAGSVGAFILSKVVCTLAMVSWRLTQAGIRSTILARQGDSDNLDDHNEFSDALPGMYRVSMATKVTPDAIAPTFATLASTTPPGSTCRSVLASLPPPHNPFSTSETTPLCTPTPVDNFAVKSASGETLEHDALPIKWSKLAGYYIDPSTAREVEEIVDGPTALATDAPVGPAEPISHISSVSSVVATSTSPEPSVCGSGTGEVRTAPEAIGVPTTGASPALASTSSVEVPCPAAATASPEPVVEP